MRHKKHILSFIAYALLLSSVVMLLLGSIGFQRDGPTVRSVSYVENVKASVDGGPWEEVTLPHTFENLSPRTPVVLTATIQPKLDDGVYIKSVYSPAKIYLNDHLAFEFGKPENYPSFMLDPATEIHIVETYGSGERMSLRMEFLSPITRSSLIVHPPMVGTPKELIMERSRVLGIPLVFSFVQLVGGVLLVMISICISFIDKKGFLFLWLGLFSVATGAWSFGENNFSSVIFRDSTFLYVLSFVGLFTFIVPLLHFTRTYIDFENPKPLVLLEHFFAVSAGIALLLQLSGIVSCSTSMYFFHLCLPPALIITAALTVHECVRHQNINAKRYILPISVLAVCAFLELFNYQIPFTYVFSSLFQMGILFFLLVMGVIAGLSFKDSLNLKSRQKELDFERDLMRIQIADQKARNDLLSQKEQLLRRQRHDLRHQLTAIQDLANPENVPLQEYLRSLMDQIPKAEEVFCENRTVNAVIAHYVPLCRQQGIDLTLHLVVPPCRDGISDSDLCVIFGNLLENAVEACERMTEGKRFIRLNSSLQYDLLAVTMDNSFNGEWSAENGRFRSSKRDDFGIGLASVQSVALKAGGDVEFKAEDHVFLSSVYVKL